MTFSPLKSKRNKRSVLSLSLSPSSWELYVVLCVEKGKESMYTDLKRRNRTLLFSKHNIMEYGKCPNPQKILPGTNK